ncbi:MAG: membrane or secreted protein [Marivirga sp.]|nr:membrane or secreted protein [Marivirga sp.]
MQNRDLTGSWEKGPEENRMVRINTEKHFSVAIYNANEKTFVGTFGGSWRLDGTGYIEVHEFNTIEPGLIGKETRYEGSLTNGKLTLKAQGKTDEWKRVDGGTPGKLVGAWVITGRVNDGQLRKMTPGARKTMKILSGTRFQWIAYNTETKEFFGTGGGSYSSENGKYVEHIDFFSRDSSRVGMSLEFDFSLEDGQWHHKGTSSKGEPINEIWTQRQTLGI